MVAPLYRENLNTAVLYSASGNIWRVADFGTSSEATSKKLNTTRDARGTACYRAPEVILSGAYNNKTDIWALGCILFELCTGAKAFLGDWGVLGYAKGQTDDSPSLFPVELTSKHNSPIFYDGLQVQIRAMLQSEPQGRPSAEKLLLVWSYLESVLEVPKAVEQPGQYGGENEVCPRKPYPPELGFLSHVNHSPLSKTFVVN